MKKIYIIAVLMAGIIPAVFAQRKVDSLADKLRTDSLVRNLPAFNKTFEQLNPGATIINRTSRGTVYNMPLDNMPVLVPDMSTVEHMPGSSPTYRPAPRSKMPNPLFPQPQQPKKP